VFLYQNKIALFPYFSPGSTSWTFALHRDVFILFYGNNVMMSQNLKAKSMSCSKVWKIMRYINRVKHLQIISHFQEILLDEDVEKHFFDRFDWHFPRNDPCFVLLHTIRGGVEGPIRHAHPISKKISISLDMNAFVRSVKYRRIEAWLLYILQRKNSKLYWSEQ